MTALPERKGIILFGLIAGIALVCAIAAFQLSGPLGIEERFSSATGIVSGEPEEEGGGVTGFSIEGNALFYALVVSSLAVTCIILYQRYRI
jgi:hypothetical protein